jgi:L-arabinose transport system substrate-binding protein
MVGMRKLITIMVVALLSLSATISVFASGQQASGQQASGDKNSKRIKLGFLVKMPEEPWFQEEWRFAQQAADKYGFDLIKIGTPDGDKVLAAIDNLGAQGAKGFVICTPDVRLGPAIISRAEQYKMKVFSVDDQFVGPDGKFMSVPYMGLSAKKIGNMVGSGLYDEMKNRNWDLSNVGAMAVTFDELNTVKERTDGATEALLKAGFPESKIFRAPEKTTDVPGSFAAADVLLTQHPEIKKWLVFSVNDEGVLGAVRALENRGFKAPDIIGIGIGAGSGAIEFKKPEVTGFFAFVCISPYRHGFETTELLYKWVTEGVQPPMDIRTDGILVTRANYIEVFKKLGLEDSLK